MDTEIIQGICKKFHHVTEDVKWGNDLCFSVGGKIFCIINMNTPVAVAFKVPDEEFEELSVAEGIIPAPYLARYKWIQVNDLGRFSKKEFENHLKQSYELVKSKLPKKLKQELAR